MTSVTPLLLAAGNGTGLAEGIDLLVLVILALGAVIGAFRGLTGELARITGIAGALVIGMASHPLWGFLADKLAGGENQNVVRGLIMVVGLVVTAVVGGKLASRLAGHFFRLLIGQPVDALLGILVGTLRSAALIVAFLFLASHLAFGNFGTALFEESLTGRKARPAVEWLRQRLGGPDDFLPGAEASRPKSPPDPGGSVETLPREG